MGSGQRYVFDHFSPPLAAPHEQMAEHIVKFDVASEPVTVSTGTLITEAAQQAGVEISQPCGGQGRCGRCAVKIEKGEARRRSTLRLSPEDIKQGYALACQTVIEGAEVVDRGYERIEERLGRLGARIKRVS